MLRGDQHPQRHRASPKAQRRIEHHGLAIDPGRDLTIGLHLKRPRGPFLDVPPVFSPTVT
jgi:hypothetical protein